uniref:Uncharacterized protein n=1 Tax=Arundo donax TaxID=35708 RepID=A0A0A8YWL2_ARUDO
MIARSSAVVNPYHGALQSPTNKYSGLSNSKLQTYAMRRYKNRTENPGGVNNSSIASNSNISTSS